MILNYKRIPYTQSYISYPDIAPLLKQLSVPPHAPGAAIKPHTLPAIIHKSTVKSNPSGALMDSHPIALHLDRVFPSPPLFPSGDASYALYLAVGKILGTVTEQCFKLVMPAVADILDPRGKEYFIATRSEMFGMPLSELAPKDAEGIRAATEGAKRELTALANMLKGREGKTGPFFEGDKPGYADFAVVAWLAWFERANKKLWEQFMDVGDGEFKALWSACLPWLDGQGEEKDWKAVL